MSEVNKKRKKTKVPESDYSMACRVIRKVMPDLNISDIQKETTFQELGFDSIKFIHLILNFEEIVDVKLEAIVEKIDFSSFLTVDDLIKVINSLKTEKI